MSADIVSFSPRGALDPVRPPSDAPARASRDRAEARAAVALAELAGEPLEAMAMERFADYRRRAVFATVLGSADGRRLCAYLIRHAVARQHGSVAELERHLEEAVEALAGFDLEAVQRHAAVLDGIRGAC
ncbi:MAG: hypothetical protein AB7R67_20155 [Vicinamibacterales bacterium]